MFIFSYKLYFVFFFINLVIFLRFLFYLMIGTYITLNKNVLEVYINADTDTLSIMIGDIGIMTQDL